MSTTEYRYRVVDVFTTRQLEGNSLAVFPDATGLDTATMQRIAQELNLAESVFLFPPSRDEFLARLRIFAPKRELAFAGHPTIGAAFILHDEKPGKDRFVLEENVGPVPVRVESAGVPMFWLVTPPIRDKRTFTREVCAEALGVPHDDLLDLAPQLLDAGNPTLVVAMRNRDAVDRATLGTLALQNLRGPGSELMCVLVFTPTPDGAYTRMFAPEYGVPEDAASGSSTGPLAFYMMRHGLAPHTAGTRFISEQGVQMGRRSILHININGDLGCDGIEIGGNVTPLADASMHLELPS
jgi:trans-2,3-dihydro-3-hydroxyanthranilate isomerase